MTMDCAKRVGAVALGEVSPRRYGGGPGGGMPLVTSRVWCLLLPVVVYILILFAGSSNAASIQSAPSDVNYRDNKISPESSDESKLLLVHVLFRHGNRTPDSPTYPKDPYINYSYYPTGLGGLTAAGKRTEYGLGSFLKQRYGDFLGRRYSPDLLYARSTDWPRTKDSIALLLAGLFPPADPDRWDNRLGSVWTPISVESTPRQEDSLLYMWDAPCPAYAKEFDAALHSEEFQQVFQKSNSEMSSYLEKHSGATIRTPEDVYNIYQALLAQKELNLTLPEWTDGVFPDKMKPLTALYFDLDTWTRKQQRLRAGPLLKKMLRESVAKSWGNLKPEERKLFLYSAHDNNVTALLRALRVWQSSVPPYGIMVMIEIRQKQGQAGVQIFMKNSTVSDEVHSLRMPDCDTFCPLDRFIQLTADVIPQDWEAECNE